jgi:hypothetical protein
VSDGEVAITRDLNAGPLRFLPRPVRDPSRPWLSIPVAWATAFEGLSPALVLFAVVVFAPVVETLIMGTVLLLLLRVVSPTIAVLISAVGWGVAHSLQVPMWGLTIWWPFLVLSTLFVACRERSLVTAFALPAIVHAMQNLGPALLIATGQTS